MPRLPDGLVVRKVKNKRGGQTLVYYWRQEMDGKDRRISLGTDWAIARTRFEEYRKNPPPLRPTPPVAETPQPLPEAPTLRSFAVRWLAEYAASERAPRGRAQAEQRFRDYLWPNLGDVPLTDLKPADLRRLNATLEARGVGQVTRRRLLEDVRCALNYAVNEAEVLIRSPWRRGMLPEPSETVPEPLNDLEFAEVVKVAPSPWREVLLVLAYTGLRWGELRAIRWADVRETPYPHLVVSRSHDGGTKSGKVREVPLLPEALDVLDRLTRGNGRVFALPETASWIRRHVIAHSRVKDFHVHRLRHTFACRWLDRGGSIEALQKILGHSTIRLTERYGRLRPHIVAAEVRKIAEAGTVPGTVTGSETREAAK